MYNAPSEKSNVLWFFEIQDIGDMMIVKELET
jgi:hypothetical protein